jgi:hypothetical protein
MPKSAFSAEMFENPMSASGQERRNLLPMIGLNRSFLSLNELVVYFGLILDRFSVGCNRASGQEFGAAIWPMRQKPRKMEGV